MWVPIPSLPRLQRILNYRFAPLKILPLPYENLKCDPPLFYIIKILKKSETATLSQLADPR